MTDIRTTPANDSVATLPEASPADGRRRIDLAFVRSGDVVELLVSNVPDDVVIRHAYWDYDAQKISVMANRPMTEEENDTFLQTSIGRVQDWDSKGGMSALKDRIRIRELEDQVATMKR